MRLILKNKTQQITIHKIYAVMMPDGSIRKRSSAKDSSLKEFAVYTNPRGPKGLITILNNNGIEAKLVYTNVHWKDMKKSSKI